MYYCSSQYNISRATQF